MNKAELIETVARRLGDRRAAGVAVEATLDTIQRTVTAGERVALSGFGVFERVDRGARTARNPATGETISLGETSVPRFRAGSGFKDVVRGARDLPDLPAMEDVPAPAPTRRTARKTAVGEATPPPPEQSEPADPGAVGTQGDPLLDVTKGLDDRARHTAAQQDEGHAEVAQRPAAGATPAAKAGGKEKGKVSKEKSGKAGEKPGKDKDKDKDKDKGKGKAKSGKK